MTITTTGLVGAVAAGLLIGLVIATVTLWRRRVPGRTATASVRAALYLTRYSQALEYYGMRQQEIAAEVDAVRAELAAGSASVDELLQRFGPPRTLAAGVASDAMRPTPLRGALWMAVTVLATFALGVLGLTAFVGAFERLAEPGEQVSWSVAGFTAEATMGPDGQASTIEFTSVWLLVLPPFAFAAGARLWRLVPVSRRGWRWF